MTHTLSISYLPCQKCAERVNCHSCEDRIKRSLSSESDIESVDINMANKQAHIVSELDIDELEEILEDNGVFLA